MPFGLTNAPATFCRLADSLFGLEFKRNSRMKSTWKFVLDKLVAAGLLTGTEGKLGKMRIMLLARNVLGVSARRGRFEIGP